MLPHLFFPACPLDLVHPVVQVSQAFRAHLISDKILCYAGRTFKDDAQQIEMLSFYLAVQVDLEKTKQNKKKHQEKAPQTKYRVGEQNTVLMKCTY